MPILSDTVIDGNLVVRGNIYADLTSIGTIKGPTGPQGPQGKPGTIAGKTGATGPTGFNNIEVTSTAAADKLIVY